MRLFFRHHLLPPAVLGLLIPTLTLAQSNITDNITKRGLLYISTPHPSDNRIFTSSNSPLTWYYNFASSPSLSGSDLEYIPMIHSLENLDGDLSAIRSQNDVEYVLIFNEPDGSTSSGGSNISPHDAARAWIEQIAPMKEEHGWKISLPATTGSGTGLEWLQSFNESCHSINRNAGCEFDFIAAHFYGDFGGMASWLGTLHEMYPGKDVWLTEFALPQADAAVTTQMMNQSLPLLDGLGWVKRYAWFGAFRGNDANEWTGDGVSLFDDGGGLTEAGAVYMGGNETGFSVGERASGDQGTGSVRGVSLMLLGAGSALAVLSAVV